MAKQKPPKASKAALAGAGDITVEHVLAALVSIEDWVRGIRSAVSRLDPDTVLIKGEEPQPRPAPPTIRAGCPPPTVDDDPVRIIPPTVRAGCPPPRRDG